MSLNPFLLDPLTELPFGLYGHLCDAYRVHWFFRGDANTAESQPHG